MKNMYSKLLIICGPTATGKTELAVKLAKIYHGELVNADSRQVYQGMDIGTGKDIPANSKFQIPNSKKNPSFASSLLKGRLGGVNNKLTIGYRKKEGIPLWLVDICKPDYTFNVGEYQKLARSVIYDIQKRGKLPIVVGGTGLYIRSILEPLNRMQIPPDFKLRQQLNDQAIEQLQDTLIRLDKTKFASMNHSDQNNPRRLVRAIEIAEYQLMSSRAFSLSSRADARDPANEMSVDYASLDFSPSSDWIRNDNDSPPPIGESLVIGLTASLAELKLKIENRVDKRLKMGILKEIQNLLDLGFNWDLSAMSGMGYKEWKKFFETSKNLVYSSEFIVQSLEHKIPGIKRVKFRESVEIQEIIDLWKLHEAQYAKRQMTFFKKMPDIKWFDISKEKWQKLIFLKVKRWYNENA